MNGLWDMATTWRLQLAQSPEAIQLRPLSLRRGAVSWWLDILGITILLLLFLLFTGHWCASRRRGRDLWGRSGHGATRPTFVTTKLLHLFHHRFVGLPKAERPQGHQDWKYKVEGKQVYDFHINIYDISVWHWLNNLHYNESRHDPDLLQLPDELLLVHFGGCLLTLHSLCWSWVGRRFTRWRWCIWFLLRRCSRLCFGSCCYLFSTSFGLVSLLVLLNFLFSGLQWTLMKKCKSIVPTIYWIGQTMLVTFIGFWYDVCTGYKYGQVTGWVSSVGEAWPAAASPWALGMQSDWCEEYGKVYSWV